MALNKGAKVVVYGGFERIGTPIRFVLKAALLHVLGRHSWHDWEFLCNCVIAKLLTFPQLFAPPL
jgi:hypothetical protein